jgi:predicted amidohydrolase YtcJ
MTTYLLFTGGLLWSPADWPAPKAAELLVTEGRIAAVGERLDAPVGSERIDLRGGTLLPAFADGHAHPLQAGLEAMFAPVRGRSIASILEGVRGWAADHPASQWVYGGGFDLSLTHDGVFDATWLDAVIPGRPVVLQGSDYHTLWCNSEALRRAGITGASPDPPDGHIVRRADGSPIGTLREWGATSPIFELMPPPDRRTQLRAISDSTDRCAASGITWIQDAWADPPDVATYLAAAAAGALTIRVNLALRADPAGWRDQQPAFRQLRTQVSELDDSHLTARTVKFFVDGAVESRTASMLAPYLDLPYSHGLANWNRTELSAAVAAFSVAGFQVHLHAIGDAAIRDALDAVEGSIEPIERQDLRPVLAHVQVVDPADRKRLAQLGVTACFQPLWAQPDRTQEVLTTPRLGPHRAALQYPIASLLADNAAVSFGSDWPVTDLSPLAGIATAVTRQTPDGLPPDGWYPGERIDLRTAFAAYTRGAACQGFRDEAGRLAVGDTADLVWLDTDLTTAGIPDVRAAQVLGTWMSGDRIY